MPATSVCPLSFNSAIYSGGAADCHAYYQTRATCMPGEICYQTGLPSASHRDNFALDYFGHVAKYTYMYCMTRMCDQELSSVIVVNNVTMICA